jgi:glycosyltransferase involved in cell wall biosynthesis
MILFYFLLHIVCRLFKLKGHGVSVVIPFRKSKKYPRQTQNFKWTKKYWRKQLPGAQIIVGTDHAENLAFSKSAAVNDGVSRATGDVLIIVDADGYIAIDAAMYCVNEIRRAREEGHRLWYVPYRQFYRLTEQASDRVLASSASDPYLFPTPPKTEDIQSRLGSGSGRGHWYGALIQIVPREAFDIVGGWDERFRGWGGEDHSIMRATDTLYWRHKTLPGQVLHLWHPMFSDQGLGEWFAWSKRLWDDQETAGSNFKLAGRYSRANGNVKQMRALVDEGRSTS